MKKKFKLTSETKVNFLGKTLFRIECTESFKLISKGDKGGWVEKESNLSDNAWVYGNAEVYGNAKVYGNAWVYGDAWEKTPPLFHGTSHSISESKKGFLKIGCIELSFKEWKSSYKEVGKKQGYSDSQIEEYGIIIRAIEKISKLSK